MIILFPKRDLKLGPSRIAVFEDCKATVLPTQPPGLDKNLTAIWKLVKVSFVLFGSCCDVTEVQMTNADNQFFKFIQYQVNFRSNIS